MSADATRADIRGIPMHPTEHDHDMPYYIRVRGLTATGMKSEWTEAIQVLRSRHYYLSIGHQHDQRMTYTLAGLSSADRALLDNMSERAARVWDSSVVQVCEAPCGGASDDLVTSVIDKRPGLHIPTMPGVRDNKLCGTSVACVDNFGKHLGIHLRNVVIQYERPAIWHGGNNPRHHHVWTDNPRLTNTWTGNQGNRDETYIYLLPIVVHEFGHTLGLPDYKRAVHNGVMAPTGYTQPRPIDWIRLRELYKDHTPNQGW